jgi:hypothetical protein
VAQVEHCFDQVGMSVEGVGEAVAQMREGGAEWSPEPSAEDKAAWQKAAEAVWVEYASDPFSKRMIEAQTAFLAKIAA